MKINLNKFQQKSTYPGDHLIDISEIYKQVIKYIEENPANKHWNGCLNKNYCCKHITYNENHSDSNLDKFYDIVFDQSQSKQDNKDYSCNKLKNNSSSGCKSCTIYKERPLICKEFLCDPARLRGQLYAEIVKNKGE